MPVGLKGKVYHMVVRPAVLYGAEWWPIKKTQIQKLMVAEMMMIGWICGCTRMGKISNGVIRDLVKVVPIQDKMRETRLRWFDHVKRRNVDAPARRCERINILKGKKEKGRPKKSLDEAIREDLKVVRMTEDMAQDRGLWRDRIKILDRREVGS